MCGKFIRPNQDATIPENGLSQVGRKAAPTVVCEAVPVLWNDVLLTINDIYEDKIIAVRTRYYLAFVQ